MRSSLEKRSLYNEDRQPRMPPSEFSTAQASVVAGGNELGCVSHAGEAGERSDEKGTDGKCIGIGRASSGSSKRVVLGLIEADCEAESSLRMRIRGRAVR